MAPSSELAERVFAVAANWVHHTGMNPIPATTVVAEQSAGFRDAHDPTGVFVHANHPFVEGVKYRRRVQKSQGNVQPACYGHEVVKVQKRQKHPDLSSDRGASVWAKIAGATIHANPLLQRRVRCFDGAI